MIHQIPDLSTFQLNLMKFSLNTPKELIDTFIGFCNFLTVRSEGSIQIRQ